MRYISIDLETTSINPKKGQILEFAAIIDNLRDIKPISELPRFHTYFIHDEIVGEPYALSMHPTILRRIAIRQEPFNYLTQTNFVYNFCSWLRENKMGERITAAGKNFASFDKQFIEAIPEWRLSGVKINHRCIDPAMAYWTPEDSSPPDTKMCMERAGIKGDVAHTAMEDAEVVVQLVRNWLVPNVPIP